MTISVPTEKVKVMGMYESPIKIIESTIDSIYKDIVKKRDDAIFAEIQSSFGVDLDRGELLRALQYDRDQYNKGYADGRLDAMDDLVLCKDCKHRGEYECPMYYETEIEWDDDGYTEVEYVPHDRTIDDGFCDRGERRTDNE